MSVLNDYTADEQLLLMEGPRLGAVVVAAASLGRKSETASEGFAAAEYVLDSRGEYLDNRLINSIQFELQNALRVALNSPTSSNWPARRAPWIRRLPGCASWLTCLPAMRTRRKQRATSSGSSTPLCGRAKPAKRAAAFCQEAQYW